MCVPSYHLVSAQQATQHLPIPCLEHLTIVTYKLNTCQSSTHPIIISWEPRIFHTTAPTRQLFPNFQETAKCSLNCVCHFPAPPPVVWAFVSCQILIITGSASPSSSSLDVLYIKWSELMCSSSTGVVCCAALKLIIRGRPSNKT